MGQLLLCGDVPRAGCLGSWSCRRFCRSRKSCQAVPSPCFGAGDWKNRGAGKPVSGVWRDMCRCRLDAADEEAAQTWLVIKVSLPFHVFVGVQPIACFSSDMIRASLVVRRFTRLV